jgi:WD40 repeat protein
MEVSAYLLGFERGGYQFWGATGYGDLNLFEGSLGKGIHELHASYPADRPYSCDYSRDGRLMASGHIGSVRIWNIRSGKLLSEIPLDSWEHLTRFNPDGKSIFITTSKGVEMWSIRENERNQSINATWVKTLGIPPVRYSGFIGGNFLSDDGKVIAVPTAQDIEIFSSATGQQLHLLPAAGSLTTTVSPNGKYVASWDRMSTNLQIWGIE